MPEAYDEEGGVNQEKRFSVAMQRYRYFTYQMMSTPVGIRYTLLVFHYTSYHMFPLTSILWLCISEAFFTCLINHYVCFIL